MMQNSWLPEATQSIRASVDLHIDTLTLEIQDNAHLTLLFFQSNSVSSVKYPLQLEHAELQASDGGKLHNFTYSGYTNAPIIEQNFLHLQEFLPTPQVRIGITEIPIEDPALNALSSINIIVHYRMVSNTRPIAEFIHTNINETRADVLQQVITFSPQANDDLITMRLHTQMRSELLEKITGYANLLDLVECTVNLTINTSTDALTYSSHIDLTFTSGTGNAYTVQYSLSPGYANLSLINGAENAYNLTYSGLVDNRFVPTELNDLQKLFPIPWVRLNIVNLGS